MTVADIQLFQECQAVNFKKKEKQMDTIKKELEDAGYDFAVAIATQAEIEAGAACGQLAIICED